MKIWRYGMELNRQSKKSVYKTTNMGGTRIPPFFICGSGSPQVAWKSRTWGFIWTDQEKSDLGNLATFFEKGLWFAPGCPEFRNPYITPGHFSLRNLAHPNGYFTVTLKNFANQDIVFF
jgi:hypothetical protein